MDGLQVAVLLAASFLASLVLLREVNQGRPQGDPVGYEYVTTLWTWADVASAYDLKADPPAAEPDEAGWRNFS